MCAQSTAAGGLSGVLQTLNRAYLATRAKVLNAAAGGKHATAGGPLGQKTVLAVEGHSAQEGLSAASGSSERAAPAAAPAAAGLLQAVDAHSSQEAVGSSKGVAGAVAAPAAVGVQQAGEAVSSGEGKRTQLRNGLNLPGEDELSAVAFLDVGPPDEAVSPEGGPGGEPRFLLHPTLITPSCFVHVLGHQCM